MQSFPTPPTNTRIGFHYFPDTLHYRESDLKTWLPELKVLGASWLTILTPVERAIPECFLNGLTTAGIEPVLHMPIPLDNPTRGDSLRLLFNYYARRDVHYIALFDRPNLRAAWPGAAWAQADLVERFLDLFIPLAEAAQAEGLIPVFPPLEPGGDYWDLAFLRSALRGLKRRNRTKIIDHLVIGAYAWAGNRSLDWGAGGPERWPGARPYFTPAGVQDQCGFRIFDWYQTLVEAELGRTHPILLLRAGAGLEDHTDRNLPPIDEVAHVHRNMSLIRLLSGDQVDDVLPAPPTPGQSQESIKYLEPVPPEVLCANFWLLSASGSSPHARSAWFRPDGHLLPVVGALRQWAGTRFGNILPGAEEGVTPVTPPSSESPTNCRPIAHYLLLPLYAWGAAEWDLDRIHPFVTQYHPTVGFSPEEARLAARVTVLCEPQSISDEVLDGLRNSGCRVDRLSQDGTLFATGNTGE